MFKFLRRSTPTPPTTPHLTAAHLHNIRAAASRRPFPLDNPDDRRIAARIDDAR